MCYLPINLVEVMLGEAEEDHLVEVEEDVEEEEPQMSEPLQQIIVMQPLVTI
jgi:hypothetical protein